MKRAKRLYHTTSKNNLDSIFKEGLRSSKKGWCIYCSEKPDSWWQGEGYVTLEVDIRGMDDIGMTTFDELGLDEIMIWTDRIEPERLRLYQKIKKEQP